MNGGQFLEARRIGCCVGQAVWHCQVTTCPKVSLSWHNQGPSGLIQYSLAIYSKITLLSTPCSQRQLSLHERFSNVAKSTNGDMINLGISMRHTHCACSRLLPTPSLPNSPHQQYCRFASFNEAMFCPHVEHLNVQAFIILYMSLSIYGLEKFD